MKVVPLFGPDRLRGSDREIRNVDGGDRASLAFKIDGIVYIPAPIHLEVGKTYRTRDGRIVYIVTNAVSGEYIFGGMVIFDDGFEGFLSTYTPEGRHNSWSPSHARDLVSEAR